MDDQLGWAWAAGFFDGEGHTGFYVNQVVICISQNHREVLDNFQQSVDVGKVYGPYDRFGVNTRFDYRCTQQSAIIVLGKMWPWLGTIKKNQALVALNKASLPTFTSVYRGVRWRKDKQKWCAEIRINGKTIHLGYFLNESEAAIAYDRKAMNYDRLLNF